MTSVRDIIIVVMILFAVGISLTFIVKIGHSINSQLLNVPIINQTTTAHNVIDSSDVAINSSDYLYLALFIGFFISIIIFGWLVGGIPIMSVIYFILVVLFTFVSVIFQLAWIDLAASGEIVSTVAQLPITNYILSHLAYFTAIMGIVGILVMYAKPSESGY